VLLRPARSPRDELGLLLRSARALGDAGAALGEELGELLGQGLEGSARVSWERHSREERKSLVRHWGQHWASTGSNTQAAEQHWVQHWDQHWEQHPVPALGPALGALGPALVLNGSAGAMGLGLTGPTRRWAEAEAGPSLSTTGSTLGAELEQELGAELVQRWVGELGPALVQHWVQHSVQQRCATEPRQVRHWGGLGEELGSTGETSELGAALGTS
jgi:hypothetical protein